MELNERDLVCNKCGIQHQAQSEKGVQYQSSSRHARNTTGDALIIPSIMTHPKSCLKHLSRFSEVRRIWPGSTLGMIYLFFLMLLLSCINAATAQNCDEPYEPYECYIGPHVATHCLKCEAGEGVAVRDGEVITCRDSTGFPDPGRNTLCDPCTSGVNYSDEVSAIKKCQECNRCNSKEEIVQECNATQDYACQCKTGLFYLHEELESCIECTTCGEDEMVISECMPYHDRQCGPKPPTTIAPTTPTERPTTTPSKKADPTTATTKPPEKPTAAPVSADSVPVNMIAGIAVAAVVVVGLIIFVIMYPRCRQQNEDTNDGSPERPPLNPGTSVTSQNNVNFVCNCWPTCWSPNPQIINANGPFTINGYGPAQEHYPLDPVSNGPNSAQNGRLPGNGHGPLRETPEPARLNSDTSMNEESSANEALLAESVVPNGSGTPTAPQEEPEFLGHVPKELVSQKSTSQTPNSGEPVSQALASQALISRDLVSQAPDSLDPVSQALISSDPVSQAPISRDPVFQAPISSEPDSQAAAPSQEPPPQEKTVFFPPVRDKLIDTLNDEPEVVRNVVQKKLKVSEESFKQWEKQGALGPLLLDQWEENELSLEEFIRAVDDENRPDIVDFLRQGVA